MGMHTVDFAAHNLIKRLNLSTRAEIHRPWPAVSEEQGGNPQVEQLDKWPTQFISQPDRNQINSDDLVLSWGDFQLGRDYQLQSSKRYQKILKNRGIHISASQALDWCYEYFMLQDVLKNNDVSVASFGTTLFQNNMRDWCEPRYKSAIDRYFQNCSFAKFRDPYSAWCASKILDVDPQSLWGVDSALLNTPEELLGIKNTGYAEQLPKGMIGVYLGRSSRNFSKFRLGTMVKQLSNSLGSPLFWLPWNRFTGGRLFARRPRLLNSPFINFKSIPAEDPVCAGDIFQLFSSFRLVVTDTYHVAINAMCLGVPVLCIYEPSPESNRDANIGYRHAARDKRVLLFTSTNQSDLLMPSTDLTNTKRRTDKVKHIVDLIDNTQALETWRGWLDQERTKHRQQLDALISKEMGLVSSQNESH